MLHCIVEADLVTNYISYDKLPSSIYTAENPYQIPKQIIQHCKYIKQIACKCYQLPFRKFYHVPALHLGFRAALKHHSSSVEVKCDQVSVIAIVHSVTPSLLYKVSRLSEIKCSFPMILILYGIRRFAICAYTQ